MARITLDPEEVNQADVVTLVDGRTVTLADADARTLRQVARQLHTHRSSYEAAFAPTDELLVTQVANGVAALEDVAPLHRRVHDLLEVARSKGGRAASQVDPAELLQTRTWTSSAGKVETLEDLTPTHRRNLLGWLERGSDELRTRAEEGDLTPAQWGLITDADPWVAGTPLYRRLARLIADESPVEVARDEARQVVRNLEFERKGRWPDR